MTTALIGDTAPARSLNRKTSRLAGLDWVKGALVLIMVLYHWLNYFIGESPLYRYLRFLTPSFIFLTGFLIAHVYLPRFAAGTPGIPARLLTRGLKLLALVLLLNAAAWLPSAGHRPFGALLWACGTGSTPVAFSVLFPIGYLLLLSAALLVISRKFPPVFHLASALLIAAAAFCESKGTGNGYLDMLGIGALGVSAGHIAIGKIHRFLRPWPAIAVAYAAYLYAITEWNVIYLLQVAGVCVNLAALYRAGWNASKESPIDRALIRLGEYSLFAYIAQIVILQILRQAMRPLASGMVWVCFALFAGAVCTLLSVQAVDEARRRAPAFNRLYGAVFS